MTSPAIFSQIAEPSRLVQKPARPSRPAQAAFTLDTVAEKAPAPAAKSPGSARPAARESQPPRLDRGEASQHEALQANANDARREQGRSADLRQDNKASRLDAVSQRCDRASAVSNREKAGNCDDARSGDRTVAGDDADNMPATDAHDAAKPARAEISADASAGEAALSPPNDETLVKGGLPAENAQAEMAQAEARQAEAGQATIAADPAEASVSAGTGLLLLAAGQPAATGAGSSGDIAPASAAGHSPLPNVASGGVDLKTGAKPGTESAEADAAMAKLDASAVTPEAGNKPAAGEKPEAKALSAQAEGQPDAPGPEVAKPAAIRELAAFIDQMQPSTTTQMAPAPAGPAGSTTAAAPDVQGQAPAHLRDQELRPTPINAVPVEIGMKALAGIKRFDIRLDPPELGRVDVRIEFGKDGDVSAQLVVDRVETLHLLQRDARHLERAFDQAGLKTGDGGVQISLSDRNAQNGSGQPENGARSRFGRPEITNPESPSAIDALQPRRMMRLGGVDVSV